MKLYAHYNRANIVITLSVLIIGAIIYYFAINYVANDQVNHDLRQETQEANDFIIKHHRLPGKYELEGQQTIFNKTNISNFQEIFYDTLYTENTRSEAGRAEVSLVKFNGENYRTTVVISRENTQSFIKLIAGITLVLAIGLLLTLFITNRYILNGLWRPFHFTLAQIKAFNIADSTSIETGKSKVDEFNELNDAVQAMSARVKTDFQHLKQFTENASHEMLTPLAVITAKLDTLIQDETLKYSQYEQLTDIYTATGKLSRLNQSLLLLVKIENNLIHDEETIGLEIMLTEKLKQFQELLATRNIELKKEIHHQTITASKYLTDILLNNLISNAIRHNVEHGQLTVLLSGGMLIIQNSGSSTPLNAEMVFERFQKGTHSEGTGLGLAIVKNICNMYGWQISYDYNNQLHTFQLVF